MRLWQVVSSGFTPSMCPRAWMATNMSATPNGWQSSRPSSRRPAWPFVPYLRSRGQVVGRGIGSLTSVPTGVQPDNVVAQRLQLETDRFTVEHKPGAVHCDADGVLRVVQLVASAINLRCRLPNQTKPSFARDATCVFAAQRSKHQAVCALKYTGLSPTSSTTPLSLDSAANAARWVWYKPGSKL